MKMRLLIVTLLLALLPNLAIAATDPLNFSLTNNILVIGSNQQAAEIEMYIAPSGVDGAYVSGDLWAFGPYKAGDHIDLSMGQCVQGSRQDCPNFAYPSSFPPTGTRMCVTAGDALHGGNHTSTFICFTH